MDNNEEILKLIKDNPVFIFSLTRCPYCVRVKSLFDKLKVKYGVLELDKLDRVKEEKYENALESMNKHYTYPQVFVNSTFIGGCDGN